MNYNLVHFQEGETHLSKYTGSARDLYLMLTALDDKMWSLSQIDFTRMLEEIKDKDDAFLAFGRYPDGHIWVAPMGRTDKYETSNELEPT